MIQIWKSIENLQFFDSGNVFQYFLITRLPLIRKTYFLPTIAPFYQLIKQMTMCLITDFCISRLITEGCNPEIVSRLVEKKNKYLLNSKQLESTLVYEGKMRQKLVMQSLYLVVTSVGHQILSLTKENCSEDHLFQRLNLIYNKCHISNKCLKVIQKKLAITRSVSKSSQKSKKQNPHPLPPASLPKKENAEFRKTFFSTNDQEQKERRISKMPNFKESNSKILKLIRQVKETLQTQSHIEYLNGGNKMKKHGEGLMGVVKQSSQKQRSRSCYQLSKSTLDEDLQKSLKKMESKHYIADGKLRIQRTATTCVPGLRLRINHIN